MTDLTARQARSFGDAAADYDRHRPSYAPAAVAWALGEPPLRVLDLGAGTGILSRVVRGLGHRVVAVEPDARMRRQLAAASPGVVALGGTAEQIPLATGAVDAVVCGQAYHWFEPTRALPEIARVLHPGGVFAPMWNDADPAVPWTVRLVEIVDGSAAARAEPPELDLGERFGAPLRADFRHDLWLTPDDLLTLVSTRSPYLVGSRERRAELRDAVRELIAGPDLAGRPRFAMPHVTRVYRAEVR